MIQIGLLNMTRKDRVEEVYIEDLFQYYLGPDSEFTKTFLEATMLSYEGFLKFCSTTFLLQGLRLSISMFYDMISVVDEKLIKVR